MNIIKVSTDSKISVHKFPEGNIVQQNIALCNLIGNHCRILEHVMPKRLYDELGHSNDPTNIPGKCVSMLVDDEGLLKSSAKLNMIGSFLYGTNKHSYPIVGNVLFVGENMTGDGIQFCGIEESSFEILKDQLEDMVKLINCTKRMAGGTNL